MKARPPRRPTRPAGASKRRRKPLPPSVPLVSSPTVPAVAAIPRSAAAVSGLSRVEFAGLWLVGLVYYFVTAPPLTPFPVWAGWTVILTTIAALIILGRRFPMFGLFLLIMITSLMRGGRRRRW